MSKDVEKTHYLSAFGTKRKLLSNLKKLGMKPDQFALIKDNYKSSFPYSIRVKSSALSEYFLKEYSVDYLSFDCKNLFPAFFEKLLKGEVANIEGLKFFYVVDSNDYLYDCIFMDIELIYRGKELFFRVYGHGLDKHLDDCGYGRKALKFSFELYDYYQNRYRSTDAKSLNIHEINEVIQCHDCHLKKIYDEEPDTEMIRASGGSLEKRALGESLGLSFNPELDDFE
jgi:hypothetical protein